MVRRCCESLAMACPCKASIRETRPTTVWSSSTVCAASCPDCSTARRSACSWVRPVCSADVRDRSHDSSDCLCGLERRFWQCDLLGFERPIVYSEVIRESVE